MARPPATLLALSFVVLAVSGCINTDPPSGDDAPDVPEVVVPDDWWVNAIPSSLTHDDHDHSNRSHHAGITTPNFEVIGWDPLITEEHGSTLTGMGCGGAITRDDGRRLAIVHSIATTVSFVVADITDPTAPQMLGEFYLPNSVVWDADISADGNHVLIGAYPPLPLLFNRDITLPIAAGPLAGTTGSDDDAPEWAKGRAPALAYYRSACTGNVVDVGPANYLPGPAIIMAGIQDPENPTFEDYKSQPVIGPHSVGSQAIDGHVFATSSVTNLVHEGSYYTFYEITDTPAGSKLREVSMIRTPGLETHTLGLNGHTDVYIHKHPHTGQYLAYLANWDGMYVYDLAYAAEGGPYAPVEIGSWHDGDAGSVHTTFPFPFLVDDRQYLVVGQEVGEPVDLPSGYVYILDVTDPLNPTEMGRWTLPVKPKWDSGGLQFSPHYVAVLNQTLFVSNYHGGLWALNITDLTNPQAIGIFLPDQASPAPYNGGAFEAVIEDVIVDQETYVITTWDNSGGVYQLRFDPEMEAPRAPMWGAAEASA